MTSAAVDWAAPGFDLPPAADLVGPFPGRAFLEAWWRHHGGGEPRVVAAPDALLALRRTTGGVVEFMGEAGLTDYHAPLGPGAEALVAEVIAGLAPGTPYRFDSLPREAAELVARGVAAAQAGPEPARPVAATVAGVLALPGPKGGVLTGEMEAFFADLLEVPGARLDLLCGEDEEPVAAAFGFQDERAYYLYNSAYDPRAAAASPGAVLVDSLVQRAIAAGLERFDFLKGDEPYKFRLGGRPRPLFVVEGVR